MKISNKTDYALRTIFELAMVYPKGINIKNIVERQDMPKKFVEGIILNLKNAGYVKTKRGNKGGIWLCKNPKEIKIGDIIKLFEKSVSPIDCLDENSFCKFKRDCVLMIVFKDVKEKIEEIIDNVSFLNLIEEYNRIKKENLIYII